MRELHREAVRVIERRVLVVRHHLREQEHDVELLGSLDEAVEERVVDLAIRRQQELTLRAATVE
jgi:hypothetical protein